MNILLITSDQQRWDTLGRLNGAIRTPNLDRLSRTGILFDRGYTVNPVCTPSRVSILTGQYPSRHGCYHVGTNLPADYAPTLSAQLTEAGYFTGILGKAHFRACRDPASLESAPRVHDLDFFRNWSGPYHGFEHARLVIGHTSEAHASGMHYGAWLRDRGISLPEFFDIHDYNHYGPWSLPAEYHGSRWVADETITAIDLARAAAKPFFLWSSFQDPHNPYVVPEPWATMYSADTVPAPEICADEMADKPEFYGTLMAGDFYGADPQLQNKGWGDCKIRPKLSARDARSVRAAYFGMISLMDHHIGRILDKLESDGLLQDTLIVFSSDHGDYLGDHGLWGKGLPTYESMQRVPFIVHHPRCRTPGAVSHSLQSLVDIEATCLDAAGLTPQASSQGVCQTVAWQDCAVSKRDHVRLEFRPAQGPFKQRTWVEQRYKLVTYDTRDYGELYDLQEDPRQLRNLFGDAAHRCLRDELVDRYQPQDEPPDLVRERMAGA
jgi:arylsulfatase A-like enzyme